MHEVSLVSSLIDQIEMEARLQHFEKVIELRIEIGDLSGVSPDAILFCYPELIKGTILDGARLQMERRPVVLLCGSCQQNSTLEVFEDLLCSKCGSNDVKVISGKEFRIIDLEVI